MATFVLTDPDVNINGVDLSNRVRSVTVKVTASDEDFTAGGATGKARKAGLRDDSFTVEFNQDFAAGNVDATLFPLVGAAPFTVIVKPTTAAVSATNPSFTGSCILTDYAPIDDAIGAPATTNITLPVDGTIARATS